MELKNGEVKMFQWLREYDGSTAQTKYFVLNGLVYGLAIIITTVYCYGRLDFVRSYPTPAYTEAVKKNETLKLSPPTSNQKLKNDTRNP